MRTRTLPLATLLLAVAGIHAADRSSTIDTKAAFSRLKTLAGEWEADTPMGKSKISYEVIAGGTSLIERETIGDRAAMVTVYHLDGNRLILTHYCMAGNQPRMQASRFDPQTGELRFEFLDATNLTPGAGHMHNATLRIPGNDHMNAAWEFFEAGERKKVENFEFTRVR